MRTNVVIIKASLTFYKTLCPGCLKMLLLLIETMVMDVLMTLVKWEET